MVALRGDHEVVVIHQHQLIDPAVAGIHPLVSKTPWLIDLVKINFFQVSFQQVALLIHHVLIASGYPLLLVVPTHRALLVPCLFIVGVGYGGLLPSMAIMSVGYFGRTHLGKILGVYKIAYDTAAATAPLFTAYLFDLYGSYAVPDVWNTAFAWIGVALVFFGLGRGVAPRAASNAAPLLTPDA